MTDAPRFDLSTPEGRRKAEHDLMWTDHGFLRVVFQNFHWISDEMARANQPSPKQIARYAKAGFKTIINLRGVNDSGQYLLEKEACERWGLALVNFPVRSRDVPTVDQIARAKEIVDTIAYPALMHCKSGADRAGLMAVLYKHFRLGLPISQAVEQLSLKYLHIRQGKTGMIDFFFATYIADTGENVPFETWVREQYDYTKVRGAFFGQWWANILVDKILRRE
jgi:uncharacterized protein (TIGR01244 family)